MADEFALFKNLRPASFRKIPFQVDSTELEGGRRKQIHEYPKRDKPYAEDMGRATRKIAFDAFVIGKDYQDKVDALLGALEENGSGTLIHPWFGTLQVDALTYRVSHDRGLGYAKFSLSFVESGELAFPSSKVSTAAMSRKRAAQLEKASVSWFSKLFTVLTKVFTVLKMVNYVVNKAMATYGQVLNFLADPVYVTCGALGFGSLPGNLSSLVSLFNNPPDLGWKTAGLLNVSALAKSGTLTQNNATKVGKDATLNTLVKTLVEMSQAPDLASPAAPLGTGTAQQAVNNDIAIKGMVRQLLLVQAVGLSSYVDCAVYDDAMSLRAALVGALDKEAIQTTDDDVYQALMAARAAVYDDLTERSRDSARLLTLTPVEVVPMLAIAYDYYQDASRDLEMVDRNRIDNPNFVPVSPLRVLSR